MYLAKIKEENILFNDVLKYMLSSILVTIIQTTNEEVCCHNFVGYPY